MTVRVVKGSGRFPLYVRIPRWAKITDAGKFRKFERDWKPGDTVTIEFPMTVEVSHWDRGAVAVRRGPLLYSLKIGEDWQKVEKYAVPYENRKIDSFGGDFPRWEIRPTTPWNYALALRSGQLVNAEVVGEGAEIRVRAAKTAYAGWGCMRAEAPGRAIDPPYSPVRRTDCAAVETVSLIPVGMTQLHLVLFPWFED